MKTGVTFSDNQDPLVATIGFFDGVHRGHCYLIEQVRAAALARGLASAVVTFAEHPRSVMQPSFCPELLTTRDEKVDLLSATGVDYCILLHFTPQLVQLSAYEFMKLLKERYRIAVLVIGYDHRFGHNRQEGFDDYVRYGKLLDMEVLPAQACSLPADSQQAVSSSRIRGLLAAGNTAEANYCLGYDYFLQGMVVGGHRVGRTIGFPTANLQVNSVHKLIPVDGVYAAYVTLNSAVYGGMLSIGHRPTLHNGSERSIEVHIFDFHADIYRQPMRLSLVCRTRAEQRFASLDLLIAQLHRDEAEIRALLAR